MNLTAVIIDDEKAAIEALRQELRLFAADVKIIGEATTIKEGVNLIRQKHPLIVFLDIQIQKDLGFDLVKEIDHTNTFIIYTTAYGSYTLKAIKGYAYDYLLKPVNGLELSKAINRIEEDCKKLLYKNKIIVSTHKGKEVFDIDEVIFFEAIGNYTQLHLTSGKKKLLSKSMKAIEDLNRSNLFRIHRSTIVNVNHVVEYLPKTLVVKMINDIKLNVSQRRRGGLSAYLKQLNLQN